MRLNGKLPYRIAVALCGAELHCALCKFLGRRRCNASREFATPLHTCALRAVARIRECKLHIEALTVICSKIACINGATLKCYILSFNLQSHLAPSDECNQTFISLAQADRRISLGCRGLSWCMHNVHFLDHDRVGACQLFGRFWALFVKMFVKCAVHRRRNLDRGRAVT